MKLIYEQFLAKNNVTQQNNHKDTKLLSRV